MLNDLLAGLLSGLAFGVLGIALLVVGFFVVDLLTPGNLGQLVYAQRNRNAALVVASALLAVAAVTTTAIMTSEDDLAGGLLSAGAYGLLGIGLQALAFIVIDKMTPGDLGEIVCRPEPEPAVWVTVATQLAVGAVAAAAIA